MQSQLMAKILGLEESNEVLREELDSTKKELAEEKSNAANTLIEKNDLIRQLTQRVESMEASYESVLNEARRITTRRANMKKVLACLNGWHGAA